MNRNRLATIAATVMLTANIGHAHDFGFAGILSNGNTEDLPPIELSVGKPISEAPMMVPSQRFAKSWPPGVLVSEPQTRSLARTL